MIANHLIPSKDTHIQNYFPDKNYFPDYFPSHFRRVFRLSKTRTVRTFFKKLDWFFFRFWTQNPYHLCRILPFFRQNSTFSGIWYGIRSIFQFFPLNNFLKKNFILYILYINCSYLYLYLYIYLYIEHHTNNPPPNFEVNTSLHKFYIQRTPEKEFRRKSIWAVIELTKRQDWRKTLTLC